MIALMPLRGSPSQLQDRTCLISYQQHLWLHIEFQNSDKLSWGKMIKWFMLNFAGRDKGKGCQSGSWEQMSYSSWGSSIRLSFPVSFHHWQPRFTSWRTGRGLKFGARWIMNRHYYSINQAHIDKMLPWIFDGGVFPEMLVKHSVTFLLFARSLPTLSTCISLKNDHKTQRHLGVLLQLVACWSWHLYVQYTNSLSSILTG
jgi:hypothetical protein